MIKKIVDKQGVKWDIIIETFEDYMEGNHTQNDKFYQSNKYIIRILTNDQLFLKRHGLGFLPDFWMRIGGVYFYPDDNLGYITEFFLTGSKDLRNRGIGTQIEKLIEQLTRDKNIDVISGFVSHHQKESAVFWKKMGFELIEIENPKNKNLKYVIYKKLREDISNWNEQKIIDTILKHT